MIVGTPAEVPHIGHFFGLHRCRYGYQDYINVAGVISNYSAAGIPLETMWTDIGKLWLFWCLMCQFTVTTKTMCLLPTARMREIIEYFHKHDQRYDMFYTWSMLWDDNHGTELDYSGSRLRALA